MSFTIQQRIGKYVYLYEVESYWDPVKKQPRQKRRYIGKKDDKSGDVITPRKGFTPRASRDYGDVYLLRKISEDIGLTKTLKMVFPEHAELLLELACFQIIEKSPLYLFRYFLESHYSKIFPDSATSQRLSDLLEHLGKMDRERELFFYTWSSHLKGIKAIIFDITSLSSYSRINDFVEWGYNRDGEKLPQVNLGVIFVRPLDLPLAYRVYPGSIPDVSTLYGITEFIKSLGIDEMLFVLDRGFFSERNLKDMHSKDIRFVIPMPFSSKLSHMLISRYHKNITRPSNGFRYEDRSIFHMKTTVEGYNAHIYFDMRRRAEEMDNLIRRLTELEDKANEKGFTNRQAMITYMEGLLKNASRLFSITQSEGRLYLKRKDKAISRLTNRMGHTIILTNDMTIERDKILSLYKARDFVEHLFDILKNEIRENRLRVSSRVSMEGRLFIIFLSLILYAALDNRMREKSLYKKYSVSEVLHELKKLRYVEMTSGKTYLTEITKKQRLIYDALGVPIPVGT